MDPAKTSSTYAGRWIPLASLLVVLTAAVPLALVACSAANLTGLALVAATLALTAVAIPFAWRVVPVALQDGKNQRLLFIAWLALALTANVRLAFLGCYMGDVERVEYAYDPPIRSLGDSELEEPFFVRHNCFTSYIIAAQLASENVENIYERSQYRDAERKTVVHETIGEHLTIDRYQYPPPFLILPRALMAVGGDFFQVRGYWFVLNILVFGITIVALARWLSGDTFSAYWFAWPAVMLAPNTLGTLQIGNVHGLIVCMSLLAMLMFERRRHTIGGMLLGFAIASKIFPGVLLIYLVARRRWAAVLWTGGAMVATVAVSLAMFGTRPFEAFVSYQLPKLASGEAFSFAWEHMRAIAVNSSVMGAVYKLEKLGVLGGIDPAAVAKIGIWVYTCLLIGALVLLGIKHGKHRLDHLGEVATSTTRSTLAATWIVIIIMGQLRSPFLPWAYGNIAVLFLLVLLISTSGRRIGWTVLLIAAWCGYCLPAPLPFGPETIRFDMAYTFSAFVVLLSLCLAVIVHALRQYVPRAPVA